MPKIYDVIVTRNTTESCTMVVETENRAAAVMLAHDRSYLDPDLAWEQDDTLSASKMHYVTHCEAQDEQGS